VLAGTTADDEYLHDLDAGCRAARMRGGRRREEAVGPGVEIPTISLTWRRVAPRIRAGL
jgi:hypothetical protein